MNEEQKPDLERELDLLREWWQTDIDAALHCEGEGTCWALAMNGVWRGWRGLYGAIGLDEVVARGDRLASLALSGEGNTQAWLDQAQDAIKSLERAFRCIDQRTDRQQLATRLQSLVNWALQTVTAGGQARSSVSPILLFLPHETLEVAFEHLQSACSAKKLAELIDCDLGSLRNWARKACRSHYGNPQYRVSFPLGYKDMQALIKGCLSPDTRYPQKKKHLARIKCLAPLYQVPVP